MSFAAGGVLSAEMKPVVHLELHTGDLQGARGFYADLFGWKQERIEAGQRSYLALELGRGLGGGIVECATERALWLPYVEVAEIRRRHGGCEGLRRGCAARAARGTGRLAKRRCHAGRRRDRALAAEALSLSRGAGASSSCSPDAASAGAAARLGSRLLAVPSRLRRVSAKRSATTLPIAPTLSVA